ncbi:4Fe-4S binding protein [Methanosarcina sp. MSH10X1]|uniref:4Fe-4S binding protein n=1 Tax=Methanosarcina sp. MSH10X1 TaxID=2507075 RepID=UPI00197C8E06|nr:4Fe-4S binding protein [Methanosarcina sp. MSH10X1]
MLKITPYLGILVLIVSIGGLWYPALGYFMLLIFAAIFLISPFRGRWFCGNLCPRGSFVDFWVSKISRKKKIPDTVRSLWVRVPVFFLLMGFMGYRIANILGSLNTFEKIGMVFVTMCLVTTAIAFLLGTYLSPRTWCSFCPMGTAQRLIGGKRYPLKLTKEKCINCGKCDKVCPMQLKVREEGKKPDCIKCGRCVNACPKNALQF